MVLRKSSRACCVLGRPRLPVAGKRTKVGNHDFPTVNSARLSPRPIPLEPHMDGVVLDGSKGVATSSLRQMCSSGVSGAARICSS